ncbi:hypothetical protein CK203_012171 [Vitis vinifera]|uniref:Uncharacterized protein n=1 Tax=Vitis vinifera TaxID=29760 RepID=A0A438K0W7_VITVI|nr:hypothetical protein CK203_012171 [Vitis vinifera]
MPESERESLRESASERAREIDSDGKMHRAENRRKRKTSSFGVESKTFELEMVEKGGSTLTITKSKKGVSSWVHMGSNSVGLFMEGLQQCIEDMRTGNWEKRWKEKDRSFSMGKGSKGGWTAMVEVLCQLGVIGGRKVNQGGMRTLERPSPEKVKGRTFADMVKAWGDKNPAPFEWRWDGRRLAKILAGWNTAW